MARQDEGGGEASVTKNGRPLLGGRHGATGDAPLYHLSDGGGGILIWSGRAVKAAAGILPIGDSRQQNMAD